MSTFQHNFDGENLSSCSANKAFIVTNGLISQLFVITFVHPIYMQIALIWGFLEQLSLRKFVYQLWKYKLNEVCDT